jgi:hypothetical protein
VQLPDGQDRSTQINDARVVPLLSAALYLASVGPPPVILFPLLPFPCCRVSSIHLSSVVLVALLFSTIHSFSAACPTPFPHPFLTQRQVRSPIFYPSTWMSSAMVHPLSPSLSSPSLLTTPSTCPPPSQRHHTYHSPCPPRWPSCSSLKISSYSRWQRGKSSGSRSAELAGPLSIPRSSYGGS